MARKKKAATPTKRPGQQKPVQRRRKAPKSGFIPLRQKATIVSTAMSLTMLSPVVALLRENH
jgi:hypothetical protein